MSNDKEIEAVDAAAKAAMKAALEVVAGRTGGAVEGEAVARLVAAALSQAYVRQWGPIVAGAPGGIISSMNVIAMGLHAYAHGDPDDAPSGALN